MTNKHNSNTAVREVVDSLERARLLIRQARRTVRLAWPTPVLDRTADRMAVLLEVVDKPLTITDMARALDVPRGTVCGLVRRPVPRHGGRFKRCGKQGSAVLYARADQWWL